MKCIFLFFVIIYFDITYCMNGDELKNNIDANLSAAQKAAAVHISQNVSLSLSKRDCLVLHRNKLLSQNFYSDIKLFSRLKKIFNIVSNSCLTVGIVCPMISLFGKFLPGIDVQVVSMISVLMNIAPSLLKTFVVYADDQLLIKEKLQVLYSDKIVDFDKKIAKNSENTLDLNQNVETEQKKPELNVLDESVIDIEEIKNISERTRNKLYLRINSSEDLTCKSTERALKISAFVKFLFYGGSMLHAIIPSLSDYFNQKEQQNEWGKEKIFSSCLDAINLMCVPLLGFIPRYLTKLDAKIDELLKTDILFLLYKRQLADCEVNMQEKQAADKHSAQTIENADKSIDIINEGVSVVEETV